MRGNGLIRIALGFAALLGSLSLVVWRQSRALEVLRETHGFRTERAIVEAERAELARRTVTLESRARVVTAAARMGLHVPASGEIVILPLNETVRATQPPMAAGSQSRGLVAHANDPESVR